MDYTVVGWAEDGSQLRLDHERFAYAGKFVMSNTGKAVAREDGEIIAAVAFNEDRTDSETAWLRYVTVADDRQGEGIGPRLVAFAVEQLESRGYQYVRIAVNNPFAYQALYRAGFAYTGDETGIAELVLERPGDRSRERYQAGLDVFRGREGLSEAEETFLDERRDADPPATLAISDFDERQG